MWQWEIDHLCMMFPLKPLLLGAFPAKFDYRMVFPNSIYSINIFVYIYIYLFIYLIDFNCILLSKYKPHISQCVSPLRPGNNSATRSVDRPGPAARDASPAPAGNAVSTKPWPGGGLRGVQQTKGVSWDRYR